MQPSRGGETDREDTWTGAADVTISSTTAEICAKVQIGKQMETKTGNECAGVG